MGTADRRLWTESRAGLEYAALMADPVFYGVGVPRGSGGGVLVLPGLFGNDGYLAPLRAWLRRIGYKTARSSLVLNIGCDGSPPRGGAGKPGRTDGFSGPFSIIGHSRGGMLGWALAGQLHDRVQKLILLGSPAPIVAAASRAGAAVGVPPGTSPSVADASLRARRILDPDCDFPACACELRPGHVPPVEPRHARHVHRERQRPRRRLGWREPQRRHLLRPRHP